MKINIFTSRNLWILLILSGMILSSAAGLFAAEPSRYEGKKVYQIKFTGLRNNNPADLQHVMKTTVGYPLKAGEVREDIRRIFQEGKLANVTVEIREYKDGVQLRFNCTERPIVSKITIKGTKELYDVDLKEIITLQENDVYREDWVEDSVDQMKEKYKEDGFFNVLIRHDIKYLDKSKSQVEVVFIVDEGEEIKVRKLAIMGAREVSSRHLKAVMETEEKTLFKDGIFNREKYEQDKAKVLALYKQKGYLDAQILEDEIQYEWVNPTKRKERGIFITIKVFEGEKFYFDGYSLTIHSTEDEPVYKPEEIMKKFKLNKKGELFNNTKYMQDRQMISMMYGSKGYIFARVVPERTVTEREVVVDKKKGIKETRKFVKIDFTVHEGTKAYVENIIIKGNEKTKTKVIRREVLVKEGELFNASKVQLTREKIFNLGFFKEVNIDVRPGSRQGFMNLVIDVEEQPTGSISLGGGYGTTAGFSIFADISESNLFGNGQRIGLKLEYGVIRSSVTVSFREPWLFNVPLALDASIFYQNYMYETTSLFPNESTNASYRKEAIGYSLGLSYRFLNFLSVGNSWSHTFSKVKEASGNSPDSVFRSVVLGWQEKRALSMYLYFDNRNNYLNPTKGIRTGIKVTSVGGWLGGNDHFMKYRPEFYAYFSFFHLPYLKNYPVVFEIRASGSFLQPPLGRTGQNYAYNEWLELEDRLTIGGPETLRGWQYYDPDLPTSWRSVGMYHRLLFGFEIRVPIEPRVLWFALFFDAGSLWSDPFWEKHLQASNEDMYNYVADDKASGDLRTIQELPDTNILSYFKYSYGFGFRIQIPQLPLRFWFGQKVIFNGTSFEHVPNGFNFQFSIGDWRF